MRYRIAVTVTLVLCIHVHAQDDKAPSPNVRDKTPELAIRSFFTALSNGDTDGACELLVSPKKMRQYCKIQTEITGAFKNLADAAEAAFGDDGKVLQLPNPALEAMKRLGDVSPTVNGDEAEWRTNPAAPMKLKRIDGHWKLDLFSSFNKKPEQFELTNKVMSRVAKYVGEIAADMNKGRYESVADVQAEFRRQRRLMNQDFARESAKGKSKK